jgi:hypothetical protein
MAGLRTEFPFVLPKGFVDSSGSLHRRGLMRLATARDELEPLRDSRIVGPEDPFLTIIVLTRVIQELGEVIAITTDVVENLFAVDLAYLQDFYGVINFGTDEDIEALLAAQQAAESHATATRAPEPEPEPEPSAPVTEAVPASEQGVPRAGRRSAIEEVSAQGR